MIDTPFLIAEVETLRKRVTELEARIGEYEGAITWGVTCLACASTLDKSYQDYVRAERAETALADAQKERCDYACAHCQGTEEWT